MDFQEKENPFILSRQQKESNALQLWFDGERLIDMKIITLLFNYIRFWWIVCIKVKSTKDEAKLAAYYKQADELEQKMYTLVD